MKNIKTESTHDLINRLAKREEIDSPRIIRLISEAFKKAYDKEKIEIFFEDEKKEFLAYEIYKVVDKVNNNNEEILNSDPKIEECTKISNGNAYFEIDLKNLPNFIGYKIRKNIDKLILEIRKEKQYLNFLPLKGEIVSGYIQSIQENFSIVNLGKGLGYWDKKEWSHEEKNYLGKHLRFLLIDVKEGSDLKQLILSRKGEDFIKKLFEVEIPEIREKLIEIEKIIRIPGSVSKVVVKSNKFKLDPVGTCIGKKGSRIKSILREMEKERLDLAALSENKEKMLFNLISPVEVISLVKENDNNYTLIIPEHRMSLALSGSGKMIQKIGEYLDINIHIRSFEKSQNEIDIIVWNGNINFDEYQIRKNFFNSKQKSESFF